MLVLIWYGMQGVLYSIMVSLIVTVCCHWQCNAVRLGVHGSTRNPCCHRVYNFSERRPFVLIENAIFNIEVLYCWYSVRVAIELGAGNVNNAKFAAKVCMLTSVVIGLIFFTLVLAIPGRLAMIFTPNLSVISSVHELAVLLGSTILLNSVPPVILGSWIQIKKEI